MWYNTSMSSKYTSEVLQDAVSNSTSIAGVLRYLNLKQAGGTQAHISKRIKEYGIDTSHFNGHGWSKGKVFPAKRKTAEDILVISPPGSTKTKRYQLERAMLQVGVDKRCVVCYNDGTWVGKSLTLEIDHIDGDWLNNLIENLRFLCPNCHSQQETTNKPWKHARVVERDTRCA